jgi:hypothetical protein
MIIPTHGGRLYYHVFLDTYGEYISTNEYGSVLDAQGAMPNAPTTPSNVGAILLSREES